MPEHQGTSGYGTLAEYFDSLDSARQGRILRTVALELERYSKEEGAGPARAYMDCDVPTLETYLKNTFIPAHLGRIPYGVVPISERMVLDELKTAVKDNVVWAEVAQYGRHVTPALEQSEIDARLSAVSGDGTSGPVTDRGGINLDEIQQELDGDVSVSIAGEEGAHDEAVQDGQPDAISEQPEEPVPERTPAPYRSRAKGIGKYIITAGVAAAVTIGGTELYRYMTRSTPSGSAPSRPEPKPTLRPSVARRPVGVDIHVYRSDVRVIDRSDTGENNRMNVTLFGLIGDMPDTDAACLSGPELAVAMDDFARTHPESRVRIVMEDVSPKKAKVFGVEMPSASGRPGMKGSTTVTITNDVAAAKPRYFDSVKGCFSEAQTLQDNDGGLVVLVSPQYVSRVMTHQLDVPIRTSPSPDPPEIDD